MIAASYTEILGQPLMRPPAKTSSSASILVVLWLGGCSVESGGVAPNELDGVPDRLVNANCEQAVHCRFQPDVATCVVSASPPANVLRLLGSVEAGRVVYHADRMADCIAGIQGAACTIAEIRTVGKVCAGVFEGTVPPGGACVDDGDCRSLICVPSACGSSCCPGACAEIPSRNAAVGERCSTDGDCAGDAHCSPEASCQPPGPVGAGCVADTDCQLSLICEIGICTRLPTLGETCDPNAFGPPCDGGDDYCDVASTTCVPLGDPGQPCTTALVATLFGLERDNCAAYAWCDAGTCRALPSAGQACAGDRCLPNLRCDMDTSLCVVPTPTPACTL